MDNNYDIEAYDYALPEELIAQNPVEPRDESRLMVVDRTDGSTSHPGSFRQIINLLRPGDCLVINNTRVFPARIFGQRASGGRVEFFLLHYPHQDETVTSRATCAALTRSSKSLRPGEIINAGDCLGIEFIRRRQDGSADICLHFSGSLESVLNQAGQTPLPPYISREKPESRDATRYQTVYATSTGSVAAPTAGLHFTDEILEKLTSRGIIRTEVTLHVGYGTFAPVRVSDIRQHAIHSEFVTVPKETCDIINSARREGRRVIAVGTTSVRSLEWCARDSGNLEPASGECDLYITPGYKFRAVDAIITNFHLPRSSLLILVSAFAGRKNILNAYHEAIQRGYRFYSYGDAMFIH